MTLDLAMELRHHGDNPGRRPIGFADQKRQAIELADRARDGGELGQVFEDDDVLG